MHYIEKDGKPVEVEDVLEWAKWFETADRHVAITELDNCKVSTVFLGTDYNFSGSGPPVIYETLVFGGPLDNAMDRYCTREEALKGHEAMVSKVKEATE